MNVILFKVLNTSSIEHYAFVIIHITQLNKVSVNFNILYFWKAREKNNQFYEHFMDANKVSCCVNYLATMQAADKLSVITLTGQMYMESHKPKLLSQGNHDLKRQWKCCKIEPTIGSLPLMYLISEHIVIVKADCKSKL